MPDPTDTGVVPARRRRADARLGPLLIAAGCLALLAAWAAVAGGQEAARRGRVEYALSGSALDAAYRWRLPDRVVGRAAVQLPVVPNGPRLGARFRAARGTPLTIDARKTGTSGDLTCLIAVDGVVLSVQSTATAQGSVHCEGRVP
jgi:hypothetical protein